MRVNLEISPYYNTQMPDKLKRLGEDFTFYFNCSSRKSQVRLAIQAPEPDPVEESVHHGLVLHTDALTACPGGALAAGPATSAPA